MKNVLIRITGNTMFHPEVFVENKKVTLKKAKDKRKGYLVQTDKDEIDVKIFSWYEIETKYGLFISILFFFISFFGLFDIKEKRRGKSLKFEGKIKLESGIDNQEIKLVLKSFKEGEKAIVCEGDYLIENNDSNKYFVDKNIEKKLMILEKIKKYTWFVIVVLILILVIMKLF